MKVTFGPTQGWPGGREDQPCDWRVRTFIPTSCPGRGEGLRGWISQEPVTYAVTTLQRSLHKNPGGQPCVVCLFVCFQRASAFAFYVSSSRAPSSLGTSSFVQELALASLPLAVDSYPLAFSLTDWLALVFLWVLWPSVANKPNVRRSVRSTGNRLDLWLGSEVGSRGMVL